MGLERNMTSVSEIIEWTLCMLTMIDSKWEAFISFCVRFGYIQKREELEKANKYPKHLHSKLGLASAFTP